MVSLTNQPMSNLPTILKQRCKLCKIKNFKNELNLFKIQTLCCIDLATKPIIFARMFKHQSLFFRFLCLNRWRKMDSVIILPTALVVKSSIQSSAVGAGRSWVLLQTLFLSRIYTNSSMIKEPPK